MATKPPEQTAGRTSPPTATPSGPAASGKRKPWKPKTPEQIVLEQADKVRAEIADLEEQLKERRRQLQKFEEARKIFEAT